MRFVTPFVLALLLSGCVTGPSARLTQKDVIQTAEAVAQKAGNKLDEYQPPKVHFDSNEMRWSVYFDHKPPGFPGGYICVFVDDKSGDGRLIPSD
jgi:hypothetical protein